MHTMHRLRQLHRGTTIGLVRDVDEAPECGVARFLVLLDGPWATLIVRELLHGPLRFTQIRDRLPGISAHTLTNRLRQFERNGLVTRTAYAEIPPRVVYELTEVGGQLRTVLDAMNSWALSVPPVSSSVPEGRASPRI